MSSEEHDFHLYAQPSDDSCDDTFGEDIECREECTYLDTLVTLVRVKDKSPNTEIFQYLLLKFIDSGDNSDILEVFLYACKYNYIEIINLIISHDKLRTELKRIYHKEALTNTVRYGNVEIFNFLLDFGGILNSSDCSRFMFNLIRELTYRQDRYTATKGNGFSIYYIPSEKHTCEILQIILDMLIKYPDFDFDIYDCYKCAKHFIKMGHNNLLKIFLDKVDMKFDINDNKTLLSNAIEYQNDGAIEQILKHPNFDINKDRNLLYLSLYNFEYKNNKCYYFKLILDHSGININKLVTWRSMVGNTDHDDLQIPQILNIALTHNLEAVKIMVAHPTFRLDFIDKDVFKIVANTSSENEAINYLEDLLYPE